jgi:hypothetical protein
MAQPYGVQTQFSTERSELVNENGSFTLSLEAGNNEVAVAIANNFFG